jgi:Fe(3+) dicitrate transport protein
MLWYYRCFATVSFIDSRYTDFEVNPTSGTVANLAGKRVENARDTFIILVSAGQKPIFYDLTIQNIRREFIPMPIHYTISKRSNRFVRRVLYCMDLSAEYKFLKNYNLRSGINNLTDETYAIEGWISWSRHFTRRRKNILYICWSKIQ